MNEKPFYAIILMEANAAFMDHVPNLPCLVSINPDGDNKLEEKMSDNKEKVVSLYNLLSTSYPHCTYRLVELKDAQP